MAFTPLLVVFIHTTHHFKLYTQCYSVHITPWKAHTRVSQQFPRLQGLPLHRWGRCPAQRFCRSHDIRHVHRHVVWLGMTCGRTCGEYRNPWTRADLGQDRWSASTSSPCGFTGRGIWRELMNTSKICLASSQGKAVPVISTLNTKRY